MDRLRTHRRALAAGVVAVVVAVALVIGLAQGGGGTTAPDDVPTLAQARAAMAGAPGPLARLYAPRPGTAASGGVPVLDLDRAGVRRLLDGLRGRPVLVNVWYPDCAPCRREFPILRAAAAAYGTRMGFLGLATQNSAAEVAAYLKGQPTLYPHVRDPGARIARGELEAGNGYPSSVLIDAAGEIVFVQVGEFPSLADLERTLADRLGLRRPATASTTTTEGATR
ncbi:TlpA disulfide reductase family protein [Patulibacter sp.]|uniref:TlpA family protein disulfide reductase n=1 Tax=Patulibacter sp. TaxID=1912859 RepID=UPI00271D52C0|nr:TlpA disulfide reductase family protein [Patulibacter sp.]MDO9410175.1 TlpA disulfide reductase family protein [Patulibacter sp.]